ncbi:hypothetical protein [Serratia quinivorans]|uniref:hypothetical protein n=1 Tax=Serratia quinivorans TaxID=137545 RepID=UPI0034C5E941
MRDFKNNQFLEKYNPHRKQWNKHGHTMHLRISLVDSCYYSRIALREVLLQCLSYSGNNVITDFEALAGTGSATNSDNTMAGDGSSLDDKCLVLNLPKNPQAALVLLLQLGEQSVINAHFERVVVLSPFAKKVVEHILICVGLRSIVHIICSRCSLPSICESILSIRTPMWKNSKIDHGDRLIYKPAKIFTPSELRVLKETLQGISINAQARSHCVNHKTVYTQRSCALEKLRMSDVLTLLRFFVPKKNHSEGIFT